jgi:hypothetical protein
LSFRKRQNEGAIKELERKQIKKRMGEIDKEDKRRKYHQAREKPGKREC